AHRDQARFVVEGYCAAASERTLSHGEPRSVRPAPECLIRRGSRRPVCRSRRLSEKFEPSQSSVRSDLDCPSMEVRWDAAHPGRLPDTSVLPRFSPEGESSGTCYEGTPNE